MGHGRFSDLYNPHWGRNVENASFLWDGDVGEVDGSAAPDEQNSCESATSRLISE